MLLWLVTGAALLAAALAVGAFRPASVIEPSHGDWLMKHWARLRHGWLLPGEQLLLAFVAGAGYALEYFSRVWSVKSLWCGAQPSLIRLFRDHRACPGVTILGSPFRCAGASRYEPAPICEVNDADRRITNRR